MVDINTIDKEILSSVPGESLWAGEDSDHLGELCVIVLQVGAVFQSSLNFFDSITNGLETGNDVFNIFLLKIGIGNLSILDESDTVTNAFLDVREAFGIEGTLDESLSD